MFLHTYLMKYSTLLLCAAPLISDTPNLAVIGQIYFAKVVQHLLTKLQPKITLSLKTLFVPFFLQSFCDKNYHYKALHYLCSISVQIGETEYSPSTYLSNFVRSCTHFLTQHISDKNKKENMH